MRWLASGEDLWLHRLGGLRNTVRQEMIRRQLARHVTAGASVLDIGCGQGTQAIELARRGSHVVGIEPSEELRERCHRDAVAAGVAVTVLAGSIDRAVDLVGPRRFDVVCAHGLLMYLDDPERAIDVLRRCVGSGGLLSFTLRNGDALAMRPGLRGDWRTARRAFDDDVYVNELGLTARADRLRDIERILRAQELDVAAWYGVRILTDARPANEPLPVDDRELAALLDAEEVAGARDPYRWMGSQLHVIATAAAPSA